MVVSLSKRTQFSLCTQSASFVCIPVHWFGRTLMCPGEEQCPACKIGRKKCYWYTLATINKRIEVVEMCDSLARSLQEFGYTLAATSFRGLVARGHRSSKRSVWTMDELSFHPELITETSERLLIDGISQLYQLPVIDRSLSLKAWFEAVKTYHLPALANCCIPM